MSSVAHQGATEKRSFINQVNKMKKFSEISLGEKTIFSLSRMGFNEMTEVQEKAIPEVLKGDVIVQSRTGSGKTLAFLVPIMDSITSNGMQVLVLVPTRELAQQVEAVARALGKPMGIHTAAVYGGASIDSQIKLLGRANLVVGTPGRVIDLIKRGKLKLTSIRYLVLDEADRMLDMGFLPDVRWIINLLPQDRTTVLCSATMPAGVVKLARKYMKNPKWLRLSRDEISTKNVVQYRINVGEINKLAVLSALLDNEPGKYLIFTMTRRGAQELADKLRSRGYGAHALHGDMSQSARTRTMNAFKKGEISILVATDVASRGIDVENITHVINYDVPRYPKDYVHRIGRTGRLDKKGKAITFVSRDEREYLERIESYTGRKMTLMKTPAGGRVKMRVDYREYADLYGMVAFEFESRETVKEWELVRELEKHGIPEDMVGAIDNRGKKGIVKVHYRAAPRLLSARNAFESLRLRK